MKEFVSFRTYHQLIFLMPNTFLKRNIYGFNVPQFQLDYIRHTTNPLYKKTVKLCHDVKYMWWRNQDLELQEWEDHINSKKTRILSILVLVPYKTTPVYK